MLLCWLLLSVCSLRAGVREGTDLVNMGMVGQQSPSSRTLPPTIALTSRAAHPSLVDIGSHAGEATGGPGFHLSGLQVPFKVFRDSHKAIIQHLVVWSEGNTPQFQFCDFSTLYEARAGAARGARNHNGLWFFRQNQSCLVSLVESVNAVINNQYYDNFFSAPESGIDADFGGVQAIDLEGFTTPIAGEARGNGDQVTPEFAQVLNAGAAVDAKRFRVNAHTLEYARNCTAKQKSYPSTQALRSFADEVRTADFNDRSPFRGGQGTAAIGRLRPEVFLRPRHPLLGLPFGIPPLLEVDVNRFTYLLPHGETLPPSEQNRKHRSAPNLAKSGGLK